ncbi:MAG: calcium/sodium antiporter [Akkermansiaceae bacterium]
MTKQIHREMVDHYLYILAGFVALFYGAEYLVRGASEISLKFGVSPLVVGLTVVAFGTSAPELLVCLQANANGSPDQAFGTIIGSNICNIALILGVGALIRPIVIHRQIIRREIPILLAASTVFALMLIDKQVVRWEGWVLFGGIVAYVFSSLRQSKDEVGVESSGDFSAEEIEKAKNSSSRDLVLSFVWITIGLVALKFGSQWLVEHGSIVAVEFGVSEAIIGLILLAFGTSLPELATSIVAARKGQGDIITGNAVGSCIFNILAVIGITAMVKSLSATNINWMDLGVMLGILVIITPMMWSRGRLSKLEGAVLLLFYLSYTITRFMLDKGMISV